MKAVNLIPSDSQRGGAGRAAGSLPQGPAAAVLGVLAVVLALVTFYVLTDNSISSRKATLATEQAQLAAVKAQAAQLSGFVTFASLAQARVQTVEEIATQRFDWHAALSDLAKVVPANTSLNSLLGTVSPGSSVSGAGGTAGSSAGGLRAAINAPAFELSGCTKSQDDVARLMSRLRVMNGVTRVTLSDSQKAASGGSATVQSGSGSGCGSSGTSFDLVVFFSPLPGASSASTSTTTSVASTTSATTASSSSGASTGTTTTSTTATTSSATSKGSQ